MTSPERDYSHRTLMQKLGVKPTSRVALVGNHDDEFLRELSLYLAKGASTTLRAYYDFIFLKVDAARDLARISTVAAHLEPTGRLWIFHPKGKGAMPSDADVRAAGLATGLVDNKICAYSASHTATQFVIPVALRSRWPGSAAST
jgi:hypothetical protein